MLFPILNRRVRSNRSAKRKMLRIEFLETRAVLASTIFVPTDFSTIQAAVNAAQEGDKIRVLPGEYFESVTINKDNLDIKSTTKLAAKVHPTSSFIFFVDGAENVEIEGFEISGPFSTFEMVGIEVGNGGSAEIKHNLITAIRGATLNGNQEGIGILVSQPNVPGTTSAEIEDNVITDYQKGGIVVSVGQGLVPANLIVPGARAHAEIEDNVITGVGFTNVIAQNGIQISDKASAEIEDNEVSGNFYSNPLAAGSAGILVTDFVRSTEVSKNNVFDNQIGIWVIDTENVEVEQNDVYNNSEGGIFVDDSSDVEVTKNNVFDNEFYGISLFGATNVEISQNDVWGNGLNGISLLSSSFIEVSKNDVFNNGFSAGSDDEGAGILLLDSTDNEISKNKIRDSFFDGIALLDGSTDNEISDNKIEDNGGYGLFLDATSGDNSIIKNEFKRNTAGAINDLAGTNTYSKNRFK